MKNIIKKIIKIILDSYFLYKYFFYHPLIYTSKFIPIHFKKKVIEKKKIKNYFKKKKFDIDLYREVKEKNLILRITEIYSKINLINNEKKIHAKLLLKNEFLNNDFAAWKLKILFCKILAKIKKNFPNLSLSLFLILFYENKKIKDTILKKKIDSKDDILAIDFLKLFQIINFTNSNLSYLKKKKYLIIF